MIRSLAFLLPLREREIRMPPSVPSVDHSEEEDNPPPFLKTRVPKRIRSILLDRLHVGLAAGKIQLSAGLYAEILKIAFPEDYERTSES